ncbi:MAG TPA: cell division protein ZapE [Gammaproteobacteria bacterium]
MTPLERYRVDLQSHGHVADPAQERAVRALERVYHDLLRPAARAPAPLLARLRRRAPAAAVPARGLYLWGGVGRGKTFLMDAFHDCLPFEGKLRVHFHRFMHGVHAELQRLRGNADPLELVAERLARQARVICLDEFIVVDITDAMLLGGLLRGLFARGVTLVATSNTAPDELYRNGLQRARFLPAIELLKTHTEVHALDSPTDYRLRALERLEIYHAPLDAAADTALATAFAQVAPEVGSRGEPLPVEGRTIATVRWADDVVWFDFSALCEGPRSQHDYLEIARCFHTVLLAGVPAFGPEDDDRARRFINLIDVLYDHRVKLVVSAAAPPTGLYSGTRLAAEFERTASRLIEMQSHDYLAHGHRP